MKRLLVAGAVALLVAGCATEAVSPALSYMNNVEIGPGPNGYQYVNKVSYKFDDAPEVKGDALPVCVVQNIKNTSVTLKDATHLEPDYLGGFNRAESAREAGGGQIIKYVSDDRHTVLAQGAVDYQYTFLLGPIKQSARFDVAAKLKQRHLSIVFSGLEQAQIETGTATNDGYQKLGAWPGQHPEIVVSELQKIADKIHDCVKTQ